jgi:transposase
MSKQKIKSSQIKGAKYLKDIISELKPLYNVGTDPLRPNKRQLHMDEYIAMFLMYMFSPVCDSLRSIQRASTLKDVCKRFGFKRTGLSTLSDAQHVFDASLLEPVIESLYGKIIEKSSKFKSISTPEIVLVDGTVIPAIKDMIWAAYGNRNDNKAIKCHFLYNLTHNMPMFTKITSANISEKKVLEELLESGKCYVMDRGYAKHALMQKIISVESSFVIRIRDNSVFDVVEEKELSKKELDCGIVRDAIVRFKSKDLKTTIRIVEVECKPHKQNKHLGRGGPSQGETILIATSEEELPATTISAIYKSRWQIEIFFRHFKHLLGCRHLLCHSENGVELEMYIAIIACLLIMLWTGKKPSKATLEMLYYFMIGLADEEDLQDHLARIKKQA